jgi:hypothetical protein
VLRDATGEAEIVQSSVVPCAAGRSIAFVWC